MGKTWIDRATPSLIDEPRLRHAFVAGVAVIRPIDRVYSYRVPDELSARLTPGMRVSVPFGRAQRAETGYCLDVSRQPWDSTLKPILEVLDDRPVLGPRLLELGRWIARYYASHLGRTLDLMVPAAAKSKAGWKKVRYLTLTDQGKSAADVKLSLKQAAVWAYLRGSPGRKPIADVCLRANCTPAVVEGLRKRGLVAVETVSEAIPPAAESAAPRSPDYDLTADQKAAINQVATAVAARRFSVEVLFGVTGSGKTEVYIHAMRQALADGRQAIMLVPEIALTAQTVSRLQCRFERVAMLHSGISAVERSRAWAAIASGDISVVIGTRSAVFAPCPNLGLIVVDEESEPSYKNQAAPRYHMRDVAVKRGQIEDVPVVLGSAAPSLETWKNARERKHYHVIRMPQRVRGLALPTVHLVDMRQEHLERAGVHMLSRRMEAHLRATLERKEQAVLLLNRRGYAGFLHCPKCKTVMSCPRCSVHMVFHATTGLAHCHYCSARLTIPTLCPMADCDGRLVRFGMGTQRVEAELGLKFPQARVRRMDSDAMQHARDYVEVLAAFERRAFDVLVGTQMIAKGLDFPFVSFVGVVSADTALALNDFRAEERTFQLVLQVAGRSGRGDVGGQVVVQTFAADTSPILHAVKGDYEGFANEELRLRRVAGLPPWTRMMRVVLSDKRSSRAEKEAKKMVGAIEETLQRADIKARVFGPQPALIQRLRNQYRFEVQLTFATSAAMVSAIDAFQAEGLLRAGATNVVVDVDPISLQ